LWLPSNEPQKKTYGQPVALKPIAIKTHL